MVCFVCQTKLPSILRRRIKHTLQHELRRHRTKRVQPVGATGGRKVTQDGHHMWNAQFGGNPSVKKKKVYI